MPHIFYLDFSKMNLTGFLGVLNSLVEEQQVTQQELQTMQQKLQTTQQELQTTQQELQTSQNELTELKKKTLGSEIFLDFFYWTHNIT